MSIYILGMIGGLIVFFSYFLSGVFYITQKPQIIIDRKLYKIQQSYNIPSVKDYLNNLGKKNLYTSIIFLIGFVIAIYMDVNKYSHSYIIIIIFYISSGMINLRFESSIKKCLKEKDN